MKNKRSSEGNSQKVEGSRVKLKKSTETVAPVECVFCGEKERDLSKMSKKTRNSLRNYMQQRNTIQRFRVLMCSMSWACRDVRANELFYYSKCLKTFQYHYETFLNKSKENNTDTTFKKVVVLESTIALLKLKAYEIPECPVEARLILEIYNCYLANENLPQESNIARFES